MCGIVGIVSKRNIHQPDIRSMTDALKHRGPDAQATFTNESQTVALGHTRLSIIDLSSEANQPMHSTDGRYVVVFNGEIYNFKAVREEIETLRPDLIFKTHSDTEVILNAFAAWGVDMVKRLEGMFAIALYDKLSNQLFLFRDRIGKKPLFYFFDGEYFIFASEIKALRKHPTVLAAKEIDKESVYEFLHLGYIPEPKTIYKFIRKFPAGFIGELDSSLEFRFRPYWQLDDQLSKPFVIKDETQAKSLLREKLNSAVQKRLISDVPLGAFLSGGTDSSLITAMASQFTRSPIKTFSIGFKESAFDEHHYAAQVATALKTDHHEYILSETEAAETLEKYLAHFDEPFADTSAIPTMLVSQHARKEVTVALTGDGGDELFLGYGAYTWASRLSNPWIKGIQSSMAYLLDRSGNSRYQRVAHMLEKVDRPLLRSHIFSQEQYFFSDRELVSLVKDNLGYRAFKYIDSPRANHLSEPDKQALFDLKYYLKDDLLVKVDRAAMFYALECRSPLLDQQVVEFALNLPDHFKTKGNVKKWILKELLREYLPSDLVDRPKWGFSIPLSKWLKNEFYYLIDECLDRQTVEEAQFVNFDYVERLKDAFLKQEQDYLYNRIWILIVLHKWIKDNG